MQDLLFSLKQWDAIITRLDEIDRDVSKITVKSDPEGNYINNRDMMKLLNVSKSTLQRWRDLGRLPHVKIQHKIYYRTDFILNNIKVRPQQPVEIEFPPPEELDNVEIIVPTGCEKCPLFVILNS